MKNMKCNKCGEVFAKEIEELMDALYDVVDFDIEGILCDTEYFEEYFKKLQHSFAKVVAIYR